MTNNIPLLRSYLWLPMAQEIQFTVNIRLSPLGYSISIVLWWWSLTSYCFFHGLPRWFSGKESACQCRRHRIDPWIRKISRRGGMETHFSILAGIIPWTEEPSGLMGSQRVKHHWVHKYRFSHSLCFQNQPSTGVGTIMFRTRPREST